jgi:replicative DNA helicase
VKLSAPIYVLKSQAKELKRTKQITMIEALNQIAQREGYSSWSLLQSKAKDLYPKKREDILGYLNPGDLFLLASRPGLGKTTFALQILIQAFHENKTCCFFSLEYSKREVAARMAELDENIGEMDSKFRFDFSDEISAPYIIGKLKDTALEDTVIVVDYLQLLDQQRSKPPLQKQIEDLKKFAKEKKCIFIFTSQVDRSFEGKQGFRPKLEDIRLPNPLDLKLFNKSMFLHDGKLIFTTPDDFELD